MSGYVSFGPAASPDHVATLFAMLAHEHTLTPHAKGDDGTRRPDMGGPPAMIVYEGETLLAVWAMRMIAEWSGLDSGDVVPR